MSPWKPADPSTVVPLGFRASGVRAGIKTEGPDVALIVSDGAAVGAAVFTQNQFCAPPVILGREHAAGGNLRAIVANSGCANACTGDEGLADAREMADLTAGILGIRPDQVLVASTGVIGHRLPMPKLRDGIPAAARMLSPRGFNAAALAIMTTDTSPKQAAATVDLDGHRVTITGMAKGAGMVAPRMATVFGFFATDAAIDAPLLDQAFRRAMDRSFNRVTVDGDTSTNDTACILASGSAGNVRLVSAGPSADAFEAALTAVAENLARQLARGGEGATHLLTVDVSGARCESEAEAVAFSIANSPLVKTAIYGQDPNWGRIAMAAGRAGVPFDQRRVSISLNGYIMAQDGALAPFDADQVRRALGEDEVRIEVDLNQGESSARVWTCDFSYDYVKINAEYHT